MEEDVKYGLFLKIKSSPNITIILNEIKEIIIVIMPPIHVLNFFFYLYKNGICSKDIYWL